MIHPSTGPLIALLWTHSNRSVSFLCWASQSWSSTPGGISWQWSRGKESAPLTCWPHCSGCSPGSSCADLWALFYPPVPPSPSQWGWSQFLPPPDCTDTGNRPDPSSGLCTWPCLTSWDSHVLPGVGNKKALEGHKGMWHYLLQMQINCLCLGNFKLSYSDKTYSGFVKLFCKKLQVFGYPQVLCIFKKRFVMLSVITASL